MSVSALLKSRVRRPSYLNKLAKAEDLLHHFPNGAYVGWSGFTGVGYPKKIPTALADHVEKNNLQGQMKYNLFVGASSGAETENRWARLNMIERRSPHQVGKVCIAPRNHQKWSTSCTRMETDFRDHRKSRKASTTAKSTSSISI